jgi:hypothetical protein
MGFFRFKKIEGSRAYRYLNHQAIFNKLLDRSSLFFLLLYNERLTKVIDASVAKLVDARDYMLATLFYAKSF